MAGGRGGRWAPGALAEPRRLMRGGLGLIVLGHGSLVLGAIVHGSVLRHVAGASRAVTPEYAAANVVSVGSGLLSIAAGIVAILVSHNLSRAALHWTLLSMSLLNCLLSTACTVGLALAIALTVHSRGMHLVRGCDSPALPDDARAAIATNDCPFNTTRIYPLLSRLQAGWVPWTRLPEGPATLCPAGHGPGALVPCHAAGSRRSCAVWQVLFGGPDIPGHWALRTRLQQRAAGRAEYSEGGSTA
ncbi:keratinocyte-associated protein 3 isoform X1 [Larus michahellis]|uniref:keratinocyte-associated protein 3 isoform X1 n=1 Tax=Larus michahellis TaxID=119627 RepID=UPI003D9ABE8C